MERKRGCGYRKIGGLYLVGGGPAVPCDFLPYELTVCAHCGAGVKPTRGFTWLTVSFFGPVQCKETCAVASVRPPCPFDEIPDSKCGLLWVGERFYPTPEAFLAEAREMGISRRIAQIPRELVLGGTWVFFAHRRVPMMVPHRMRSDDTPDAALTGDNIYGSAIFYMFRPTAIEKILTRELATDDELASCAKREITPVIVDDCVQHRTGDDGEPESLPLSFGDPDPDDM